MSDGAHRSRLRRRMIEEHDGAQLRREDACNDYIRHVKTFIAFSRPRAGYRHA